MAGFAYYVIQRNDTINDHIFHCAGLGPEDGGDVGDERVPVHVPAADQHAPPDYTKDVSRGKRGIGAFLHEKSIFWS